MMNPRQRKYHAQGLLHAREYPPPQPDPGRMLRQALAQAMGVDEGEAYRRTLADYRRRLDALPPASTYPELRGMRECVEAYNQGIADGSGLPLEYVMLRANYLPMMTAAYRTAPGRQAPASGSAPGCTLVYFPRSDRGPLIANNQDGLARHAHRIPPVWLPCNRAGLVLGTVSSGIFDDEVSPEEFPAPVFLMAAEMCGSTGDAVELLTRLNLFWGPCNCLVADGQGEAAVIEKSTCRYGLRPSPDGFAATTEMAAEEPTYHDYLWQTRRRSLTRRNLGEDSVDWSYWQTCARRSTRLLALVEQAKAEPTFATLEGIIYDHTGSPEQVHMDGTPCHPGQDEPEWSLRTTIWVPDERAAQYSFADPPGQPGHLAPRQWMRYDDVELVF